jgi:hypothetical protein
MQEILEDVEEVMESMQMANYEDEQANYEVEQEDTEILASFEQRTEFRGFESLYSTLLDVEHQIISPESQAEAGESFDSLIQAFQKLQYNVQALSAKERRKKNMSLRQLTLHDLLQ